MSFYLAFLIRYDGMVPPDVKHQFWMWLAPIIAGRLLVNSLFGLNRIQWRYIGFRDARRTSRASFAFWHSLIGAVRHAGSRQPSFAFPPASSSLNSCSRFVGATGLRLLRRHVYELQTRGANPTEAPGPRRLLLIGAGMMGANAARELASDSSARIVGFLDDNPRKLGCVIAGVKVLGPASRPDGSRQN